MLLEAGVCTGLPFPTPAGTARHSGNNRDGAHLTAKEAMHEAYQWRRAGGQAASRRP